MVDLAQAFSEVKSLPDDVLKRELGSPTGMLPGYLILGEMHERKALRNSSAAPTEPKKPKSIAEDFIGSIQSYAAGAGIKPQAPPPPSQGIAGLPPPPAPGLSAQGYAGGGIVSLAGGGIVYNNRRATRSRPVTPALHDFLQDALVNVYGPDHTFQIFSGGQPGRDEGGSRVGSVRHDYGRAADIKVIGPDGKPLSGDQLAPLGQYWAAKKYGGVGMEMHGGGIHLDEHATPPKGGGMAWNYANEGGQYTAAQKAAIEAGLRGEMPKIYGGGGAAPVHPIDVQRALLDTIAGPESAGRYDVIYGGKRFTDFSQHPNQAVQIQTGPNAKRSSSAAGRYQFLKGTWDEQAKKLGLKDFSPASQDAAAWNLAQEVYMKKTGNDLNAVLRSGDMGAIGNVGKTLAGTWTSLPGGIESQFDTAAFTNAFSKNLSTPTAVAANSGAAVANATQAVEETAAAGAAGSTAGQWMMLAEMFKQQEPEAAPAAPAPPPKPVAPIDPYELAQRTSFTPGWYEKRKSRGIGYG